MEKYIDKFEIDTKEEDFLQTFVTWKKEAQPYHDALLEKQRMSEQYYIGNQTDKDKIMNNNTDTVENRIFEAVETIVPIVTSKAHHFTVLPGSEDEKAVKRASSLERVLERKYDVLEIQRKLEDTTRNMLCYRFGVLKWEWSYDRDDVDVSIIDPRLMLVPKMRMDPHDLPYKIEIQEYTKSEMEEYFPSSKVGELTPEEDIETGKSTDKGPKMYRVYEVWTREVTAWFCNNTLLERIANPYYDFKGSEKKYIRERMGKKGVRHEIAKKLVFSNVLDYPTDPYVFFTMYKVGDEPFGSTSLVEIGIPIQDAINVQKRKIIDNLRRMGNGQVYMDNDAMSQEESENITDEVGLIIRGEMLASSNKIKREPGTPLPNAHFSNLQHSEMVFDNIMGVHSSTRGAGGGKTLGQDLISRQQDFTRIDQVTRVLNRGVARLALGLVQLMKMYYTETHVVKVLGEDGAVEFVKLNRGDIDDYVEIIVKSGEVLPMDKVSLRTEAVQLWQLGALDPVTLFQRLDFQNPEKAAERLVAWKQGQLTQETQAKIAEIAASAKFGAEAKVATAAPAGGEGGKVETPMNVLQRAQANNGGSAPSLPQAPKM